jgi:hypothetical protein
MNPLDSHVYGILLPGHPFHQSSIIIDIPRFCDVISGHKKIFLIGVIFLEQWVGMIQMNKMDFILFDEGQIFPSFHTFNDKRMWDFSHIATR